MSFFKSSDNIMYKCKKAITLHNYKESICKWSGTLHEYIQHVKQKHKASYFLMEKKIEKFQWKLPYLGNQLDIGIFKHRLGHFLYEIIYKEDEKKLMFALSCIDNLSENVYYFMLTLQNKDRKKILKCQVNPNPSENLKLLQNQSFYIVISDNVINQFVDSNRMLQWYIEICHKNIILQLDCDENILL